MNREIKFRAWDKKENRMRQIYMLDTSEYGVEHQAQYYGEGNYTYIRDVELMQYTGLKDKNGKDIYQSDILEKQRGTMQPIRGEVVWHQYGWFFKTRNHWEAMQMPEDFKIVGNTYEN